MFSKLQLCSTSAEDSEETEEPEEPFAKLMRSYEHLYKSPTFSPFGSVDSEDLKVFDFDSNMVHEIIYNKVFTIWFQASEDEKKRLRNTEAARRCREKIKKRTEELEEVSSILVFIVHCGVDMNYNTST